MPSTKEKPTISKDEFIDLDPEVVERGFPTTLDIENVSYLDTLREHDRFFVVYPSIYLNIPPHLEVDIQFLRTDIEKDFYQVEGGKFCPRDSFWRQIEYAAGIEWIHAGCKFSHFERRENGEILRVAYSALGTVRLMDGSVRTAIGDKSLDFDNLSPSKKGYSEKRLQMLRSTAAERVQSGAKDRAIQRLLGQPSSFEQATVCKTWVIPKARPKLDMTDPETKRLVIGCSLISQNALYGLGAQVMMPNLLTNGHQSQAIDHQQSDDAPSNSAPATGAEARSGGGEQEAPPTSPPPPSKKPPEQPKGQETSKPVKGFQRLIWDSSFGEGKCHSCRNEVKEGSYFWTHTERKFVICDECANKGTVPKSIRDQVLGGGK